VKPRPRPLDILLSALLLVGMLAAWIVFAPLELGGQVAYVILDGNSMEPLYRQGDLVLVRAASSYQMGDIIAYRNLELQNNVFHRIVGQAQDRLILKGDNNSWTDSYQPRFQDVIGRFWIRVPGAATWIRQVRQPWSMALAVVLLAGFIGAGIPEKGVKDRPARKIRSIGDWIARRAARAPQRDTQGNRSSGGDGTSDARPPRRASAFLPVPWLFFALFLSLVVSLLTGILAFAVPETKDAPVDVLFEHLGFFSYTGTAPPGLYDSTMLQTGEPIFPGITCTIDLVFRYALAGYKDGDALAGSYRILAEVAEPTSGWRRTMTLLPETSFAGSAFDANAHLDLCKVEGVIQDMEAQTGFRAGSYSLAIRPVVHVSGTLSGHAVTDTFQPSLAFAYNHMQFFMVRDDPNVDPLVPAQDGLSRTFRKVPNTIHVLGLDLSVPALRVGALAGLLLGALGLLLLSTYMRNLRARDPRAFVEALNGPILVGIQDQTALQGLRFVEIATLDDLTKLAERSGALLLHETLSPSSYYVVDGTGIAYHYVDRTLEPAPARQNHPHREPSDKDGPE
jgi:signal peptidase I